MWKTHAPPAAFAVDDASSRPCIRTNPEPDGRAKKQKAPHERRLGVWSGSRRRSEVPAPSSAVLLDAGRAQAGEAVAIDRILPGQEFLDGERVAGAGFLEGEETTAHGRDHLGLAADDPAPGVGRRKVRDRERTSVRPDDVLHPRAVGLSHGTLTH